MIIGEVHLRGTQNQDDGTVNIEFTAFRVPSDIAAVIRGGIQAIMLLVSEMADGHTVLKSEGEFAKEIDERLKRIVRKEINEPPES